MANMQALKELKFETQTQLIGFLNKHNYVWKVDAETESIFILDKSNPDRNRSREYKIKESANGNFYLSEM